MKSLLCCLLLFAAPQTKYFDPDGNYFPGTRLVIAGVEIENFTISTLEYYNNGKVDYEHPKFRTPEVHIGLKKAKDLVTKEVTVTRDTLYFKASISKDRILEFSGAFLDKRGQYWNQNDIESMKTIILEGTFTVIEKDARKEAKKAKFTYWQGD